MGKSLIVKHLAEQVANLTNNKKLREGLVPSVSPTIPVHGISVDSDRVVRTLLSHDVKRDIPVSRIFHLDMSQSVGNMHLGRLPLHGRTGLTKEYCKILALLGFIFLVLCQK